MAQPDRQRLDWEKQRSEFLKDPHSTFSIKSPMVPE
jgi:hypothetical protein